MKTGRADRTNYSATSGSFGSELVQLRKLDLFDGTRLSNAFAELLRP